jgi:hypothetical protein
VFIRTYESGKSGDLGKGSGKGSGNAAGGGPGGGPRHWSRRLVKGPRHRDAFRCGPRRPGRIIREVPRGAYVNKSPLRGRRGPRQL